MRNSFSFRPTKSRLQDVRWDGVLDKELVRAELQEGDLLLLGVSGGADSMCLLVALTEAARDVGFACHVVYVNHLFRPNSHADFEHVQSECARRMVPCHYREIEPLEKKPIGQTIEEYFRAQRYRCFCDTARSVGARKLALGHTADDLAETFLMHLLRGTGLHGLSFKAVAHLENIEIIRPLWATPRQRILEFLRSRNVAFIEDESNHSLQFTRNRVRHVLLPLLEREFNPRVRETLFATAQRLSASHEYLEKLALRKLNYYVKCTGNPNILPVSRLARLWPGLTSEVLRLWLRQRSGAGISPSSAELERVVRLIRGNETRRVRLKGGAVVITTGGQLFFMEKPSAGAGRGEAHAKTADALACEQLAREHQRVAPRIPLTVVNIPIELKGDPENPRCFWADVVCLDATTRRIKVEFVSYPELFPTTELKLPPLPLRLRNRQRGDRVSEARRLKTLLIEEKVPYYIRDYLIMIVDANDQPLGIAGLSRVTERIMHKRGYRVSIEVAAPDAS